MSLAHDLQFAVELAKSAGNIALSYYGNVARQTKTHVATTAEAVTEADRATQRHIVQALRNRFPTDGLIGEESDTGESITFDCKNIMGRNWVIDPIDGTNNFIAGLGAWAVCIGLLDGGKPVLGVVYDVTRDMCYAAAEGQGAWIGSRAIQPLPTPMEDSSVLMLTSNLIDKHGRCPNWAKNWLGQTNWKLRMLGSAALEAVQVAAGVAHAAITVNGKLWDAVAPAAIVIESGGLVSDLNGNPIFPYDLKGYVGAKVPYLACAPNAQEELAGYIRNHP